MLIFHMPVYVCAHVCEYSMHVCMCVEAWRLGCFASFCHIFGDRVSHWPEACQLGQAGWPVNPGAGILSVYQHT